MFHKGTTITDYKKDIKSKFFPSKISRTHAQLFIQEIRARISQLMLYDQETTILRDDVIVDETLWTHNVQIGR